MKYNNQLTIGSIKPVKGNEYKIVQIYTFGTGLLQGCKKYFFEPLNKNLKTLVAIQWADGYIDRLKVLK